MLVSLALLGMVAAMLTNGLAGVAAFMRRSDDAASRLDEVASARRILAAPLAGIRAETSPNSGGAFVEANGDAGAFTFLAAPPASAGWDALWRYRLSATVAGDLVLYRANALDDRYNFAARDMAGWQPATILRGIGSLRISYFGPYSGHQGARGGSGWQTSWIKRPQPPTLIRVRVTFPAGDRRIWPDLIVRPPATANEACRIDALTGLCGAAS